MVETGPDSRLNLGLVQLPAPSTKRDASLAVDSQVSPEDSGRTYTGFSRARRGSETASCANHLSQLPFWRVHEDPIGSTACRVLCGYSVCRHSS